MATRQKGLFKPVPRRNDMDSSMYREIEKIAKDCVESTKERFKNENDIANYLKKQLELCLNSQGYWSGCSIRVYYDKDTKDFRIGNRF